MERGVGDLLLSVLIPSVKQILFDGNLFIFRIKFENWPEKVLSQDIHTRKKEFVKRQIDRIISFPFCRKIDSEVFFLFPKNAI